MIDAVYQPVRIAVPNGALAKGAPLYESLMAIPGCQPWHDFRQTVEIPVSAAWIVERTLREAGVDCRVDVPALVQAQLREVDAAASMRAALDGGLYAWVTEGWSGAGDAPRVTQDATQDGANHAGESTAFIKAFQVQCIAFADRRERAMVVAEPGAGKTLIAIGWGCAGKATCPVVLYVTIATVVTQAADEWARYADVETLDLVAPSRRRKSDPAPAELIAQAKQAAKLAVLTVSYDVLRDTWDEIRDALGATPFAVVFDESQRAKQPRRKRYRPGERGGLDVEDLENVSSVAARVSRAASRVLLTTATPISNNVLDLWAQLDLVEPGGWGVTSRRFRDRYCRTSPNEYSPNNPHVEGVLESTKDELLARAGFRSIYIPYDVSHAGLPPKRREVVRVRLADQVKERGGYNKKMRALEKEAAGGSRVAAEQSLHARLARAASRKRAFVVRDLTYRLDAGKGKVLVFTGWRKEAEEIGERMGKVVDKRGGQCWVSHGADSRDERDRIRKAFLSHPGPAMLIGTWHAWGTGLNLDDVDVIAVTCLPVTPEQIAQMEGRGDRLSMTRPLTFVFYVAEGTADERVVDILMPKLGDTRALTPGTRLNAMGGVDKALEGSVDMGELVAEMLAGMAGDSLLED